MHPLQKQGFYDVPPEPPIFSKLPPFDAELPVLVLPLGVPLLPADSARNKLVIVLPMSPAG